MPKKKRTPEEIEIRVINKLRRGLGRFTIYNTFPDDDYLIKRIEINQDTFKGIENLSKPALVILAFIIKRLPLENQEIILNPKIIQTELEYKSLSNIYIGLIELLEYEFIYKTTIKGKYYVNFKYINNNKKY